MTMQIKCFTPLPALGKYIDRIWVFNSPEKIPENDLKMIVPNGRVKLIIPSHDVSNFYNGVSEISRKNSITLVGISDRPRIVNDKNNNPTGTIGIEFKPGSAYRFFNIDFSEIKNKMLPLQEITGSGGRHWEERIKNEILIEKKVGLIQQFLIRQFNDHKKDPVYEYSVNRILESSGVIKINQLEKETGYSCRWLNMKFLEKTGISPKNLAEITRFHLVYQSLSIKGPGMIKEGEFYQHYFDQSHFIRDFHRFTGYAPRQFLKKDNQFGIIFFRQAT